MVQIEADTFEDLTPELFKKVLDDLAAGRELNPGPQIDRQFSTGGGATTLTEPGLYNGKAGKTPTIKGKAPVGQKVQEPRSAPASDGTGRLEADFRCRTKARSQAQRPGYDAL